MSTFPPDKAPKPGLNIYGCVAVNPYKITIAAEELGIPYNYIAMDVGAGELAAEWYKSINPNGRAPAIVHIKEDGTTVKVFESAACLLYLASEFDKEGKISWEIGTPEYWAQLSWLSWQVAGYGPMLGQAAHFNRYSPESVPYGSWRYTAEGRRLNHVLNEQLSTSEFVTGDRLTVADIAIFIYAHSNQWCGVDINEFPHVRAWHDRLLQRPSFQKALQVPVPYPFSDAAVSAPEGQGFYKTIRKYGTLMIKGATEQWKGGVVPVPSDNANLEVPKI